MAQAPKPNSGQSGEPAQVQVRILGQYIKDMSFENPNVNKIFSGIGEPPGIDVQVNVNASRVQDDIYESAIDFRGTAKNKIGIIYDLEIVYGGMFQIQNLPEPGLQQALLIHCPALIFPFLRRLVADITREGGFPPLLLDPLDFAALYTAREQQLAQQQLAAGAKKS
jgi:preprotein translocase subunit SecB